MKMSTRIAAAIVAAAGAASAAVSGAAAHEVQIYRAGLDASVAETTEAKVRVFRGTATARAPQATAAATDASALQVAGAGTRVWLVDPGNGKLTACELRPTTQIDEHVIACHARKLPR